MPLTLKHEFVLLCEGGADKVFFQTLLSERKGMPQFDIPFPEPREELERGKEPLGGRGNFGAMLRAIRGPGWFQNLKGVLIVADSADDPQSTFKFICEQIRKVPGYTVPPALLTLSSRSADCPRIMVMLLPEEYNPGGLETLYVREVTGKRSWFLSCVNAFLSCAEIRAHGWSPEKRDKARFHSAVASTHEPDPSRSASMIWTKRDASPLFMDIRAQCFDCVESRLRTFANAARTAVKVGMP